MLKIPIPKWHKKDMFERFWCMQRAFHTLVQLQLLYMADPVKNRGDVEFLLKRVQYFLDLGTKEWEPEWDADLIHERFKALKEKMLSSPE